MLNRPRLLAATVVMAIATPPALAEPTGGPPGDEGARWSLALAGGALVPVREMRDGYQDALIAGVRVGVRARIGIGVQLAADYSPLPRRTTAGEMIETAYGAVALMPTWTIGRGTVRAQIGAGGGAAAERTTSSRDAVTTAVAPAAVGQVALELHVTRGGGLVVLAGATRTFGERAYEYGWAMAGLMLDF